MSVYFALQKITGGEVLTSTEAEAAMGEVMDGEATALQVAALIGALRMRGETIEEIVGFARAMRKRAIRVHAQSTPLVDTCGTGGDAHHGVSTFNVSTAAAFIAAGAGAHIAKHGNRAQSSQCGSADVLEALGVNVNLSPEQIGRCIDEVGIGFMFAPAHHPAMKHAGPIRKELRIRTIFNLLGPLVNPAEATCQVMGVSDARWLQPIAEVLRALGSQHALICHAQDGLDEFSTCAPTHYFELRDGQLQEGVLDPRELAVACADPSQLAGGDATRNAEIITRLLQEVDTPTADVACLNAAAVLIVTGQVAGFAEGLELARANIRNGAAHEKLAQLIAFSNQ